MSVAGFTFDGVDPGVTAARLLLVAKRVGLVPSIRNRLVIAASRPGVWDFGSELGARQIELELVSGDNANLAGTDAAVRSIAQLFDPTREIAGDRGYKQLIFDSEGDRYCLAKVTSAPTTEYLPSAGRITLQLQCADPFAYSTALFVPSAAAATLAITPSGTYKTPPIIEVTAGGSYTGAVTVTNSYSGEAITWTGTLVNTDILKFDMAAFRAYLNGSISMAGVALASTWFPLYPAVAQNLVVTGLSSVTLLKATYRARWI